MAGIEPASEEFDDALLRV